MEMLIFFFVCLIAGILAAFYQERNRALHKTTHNYNNHHDTYTVFERLLKMSRQL